jgi:hypothetical protein
MTKVITVSLADLLRQGRDWSEVESVIAAYPAHKTEAWRCLNTEERSRYLRSLWEAVGRKGIRSGWIGLDTRYTDHALILE